MGGVQVRPFFRSPHLWESDLPEEVFTGQIAYKDQPPKTDFCLESKPKIRENMVPKESKFRYALAHEFSEPLR